MNTEPFVTEILNFDPSVTVFLPLLSVSLPDLPGNPPAKPYGAVFLRSAMRLRLASLRNSILFSMPSPPQNAPFPPEFFLNPYRSIRTGSSCSMTSTGVLSVFVMCVWTASAPSRSRSRPSWNSPRSPGRRSRMTQTMCPALPVSVLSE